LPPIVISSNVESFWVMPNNRPNGIIMNGLFNLSLWLNCGVQGIKAWLPLSDERGEPKQSSRVMLGLPIKFYPLGKLNDLF
jgi:hypothetical protein